MNRFFLTKDVYASMGADDRIGLTAGSRSDNIDLLEQVVKTSVFRKTRKRVFDKENMLLSAPTFSDKIIQQFIALVLSEPDHFDPQWPVDFLANIAATPYDKPLFLETVARTIGKQWEHDTCDIMEVALVMTRLQQLVHSISLELVKVPGITSSPSVFITSVASERHTLMHGILNLLFESIGWQSTVFLPGATHCTSGTKDLSGFDVICVSWNCDCHEAEFLSLINQINSLPKERRAVVIAGGHAAQTNVRKLLDAGVDCICDSIYAAVNIAERYMSLKQSRYQLYEARQLLSKSIHSD